MSAEKVEWVNAAEVMAEEVGPGFRQRRLRGQGQAGAVIVEIDPGASLDRIDVHGGPGPEEVFVLSGIFNDGVRDYPAGTLVHNPPGSSHVPQSKEGCTLLVFFPDNY